jgi:putative acetyltransferase
VVRAATPADYTAIHRVEAAAFERDDEAGMVEAARAEGAVLVELVEELDGEIVGHILFSRMSTTPARFVAGLAPVAVSPAAQSRGVGAALCRAGIQTLKGMGIEAVIVLGHPDYYPRFGFSTAATATLTSPYSGSAAFMAMELVPAALASPLKVDYPAAFG